MPAGGVAQRPVGRAEHRQGQGRGPQGGVPGGEGISARQDLGEIGLGGEQLGQHGPQLAHGGRGRDPVPDHVADDEREAAAGQGDRIEPVTPRGLLVSRHQVVRRHLDLRQHRQRGRQQRLLQFGYHLASGPSPVLRVRPGVRRPLPARPGLLVPRVCPLRHLVGDIGQGDQQAVDRTVSGTPRRDREIGVHLPDPVRTAIDLRPPLLTRLRLPGRVHPVKQLIELLAPDLGERFPVRHADHAAGPPGEFPVGRVRGHDAMIRARQGDQNDRHLLEGIAHGVRVAHQRAQHVVRSTRQRALLPLRVGVPYPCSGGQTAPRAAASRLYAQPGGSGQGPGRPGNVQNRWLGRKNRRAGRYERVLAGRGGRT